MIADITNEAYQAHPAIGKSGLWTIYSKSPYHYKFAERSETSAQRFGSAAHCAILEPNRFGKEYVRGPDDKRGKKWAEAIIESEGKTLITSAEYDDACRIRDVLHRESVVQRLTSGRTDIELSSFWTDPETGVQCKCRPDIFNHKMGLLADIKTAADGRPHKFRNSVVDYGYHVQDPFYVQGWNANAAVKAEAFLFIVIEKTAPFAYSLYELSKPAVEEGERIIRASLASYAKCAASDNWPSYVNGVTELDLPAWAYGKDK